MNLHQSATGAVARAYHNAAPHPDAKAEWWFLQGRFDLEGAGHDVMVMLGRATARAASDETGWILLVSLREEGTRELAVTSLATENMTDEFPG